MIISQIIRILTLATASFAGSILFTPLWLKFLKKRNFAKKTKKEGAPIFSSLHQKKEGTLTAGGVIIWLPLLVLVLFIWFLEKIGNGFFSYLNIVNRAQTYLPLAAFFGAAIIGLIDDVLGIFKVRKSQGLQVKEKIFLYTFISLVGSLWFYFKLNWDIIHLPLIGSWSIGAFYILFFVFVLVASAFSANETDGLDGLLGGTMLPALSCQTIVAFSLGKYDLACFLAMITGSLLAFLWDNIYPAKFFGGDTASMSLGIILGIVAILTHTVFLLPFFAFIPVLESLSVIIQVISKKFFQRKIFISTPIHHHFEAKGWPEPQITMRFWLLSWLSSVIGLIIFFLDKFL